MKAWHSMLPKGPLNKDKPCWLQKSKWIPTGIPSLTIPFRHCCRTMIAAFPSNFIRR